MGTTIFYFTGTGNSLMIARDLAEELGGAKIVSIAKTIREPEIDLSDECIGFVFPVFFLSIPLVVRDFIRKLPLDNSKYIFAVANYGGQAGDILHFLAKFFDEQQVELAAGFQLVLPDNYIIAFNPPGDSKQEMQFKREKLKVKEIAEVISARKRIGIEKVPFATLFRHLMPVYNRVLGMESDSKKVSKINNSARNFRADTRCNGCSRCRSLCPVGNIEMVDGKPKWQERCQQCLACIHWCPQKAIEYGDKTIHRKRYTNPTVTMKDIITAAYVKEVKQ